MNSEVVDLLRRNIRPRLRFAFLQTCGLLVIVGVTPGARADTSSVRLGNLELKPTGLIQVDGGGPFDQTRADGQGAGVVMRRGRVGGIAKFDDVVTGTVVWNFGGTPGSVSRLYEADVAYSGSLPLVARAGVFNSNFTLDNALGGGDSLMTEVPTIDQLVVGLVSGGGRTGAQIGAKGDRYFASLFLTGGRAGPGHDGDQRAVLARAAGLVIDTDDLKLHVGASGAWLYQVPRAGDGSRTVTLSNQPEFQLTLAPPAITTGAVPARGAHLGGVEAALNWNRIFLQSEAYAITINGTGSGRSQTTAGSYLEAAYLFAGKPRQWQPGEGGWHNPRPDGGFGALEAGLRYSYADVHGLSGQGGRQGVYAAVLNWYPIDPLRFTVEGGHGRVRGGMAPRSVDFAVIRGQISF